MQNMLLINKLAQERGMDQNLESIQFKNVRNLEVW